MPVPPPDGDGSIDIDVCNWNNAARLANTMAHTLDRLAGLTLQEVRPSRTSQWWQLAGHVFVRARIEGRASTCATGVQADIAKKHVVRVKAAQRIFVRISCS